MTFGLRHQHTEMVLHQSENVALYAKQGFLFHNERCHFHGPSSSEWKESRFQFLEIEAKAVLYNELGFRRRQPRLVTYATEKPGGFAAINRHRMACV